jgi:hypothetical protein
MIVSSQTTPLIYLSQSGLILLTDEHLEAQPQPDYLIDGHIEAGSMTCGYGLPASAKTFTFLGWALCIATGISWAGRAVKPGKVVYVVGEGTRGIQKRVRAWKQHHGVERIEDVRFTIRAVQLLDPDDVKALLRQIQFFDRHPSLIVFDTLATCFVGGDENSAQDMGRVIAAMRYIQYETCAAILVVHHTGKPRADGTKPTERGSSALRGAADAMIRVQKDAHGQILITNDKRKDDEETKPVVGHLRVIDLGVGADGRRVTSCVFETTEADIARAFNPDEKLPDCVPFLAALASCGGEATPAEWEAKAPGSRSTLDRARRWLVDKDYVEELPKHRYRLTAKGASVMTTSRPVGDVSHQSASHPEGVTLMDEVNDADVTGEAA